MKYFKILVLIFIFSTKLSYAIDFKLSLSDQVEDVKYFSLQVQNNNKIKNIDVALEGDANNVTIKQYYSFQCKWGRVTGVRLSMDSSSADGPL